MRTLVTCVVMVAASPAGADLPDRYVGAGFGLTNGLQGASEVGFALQIVLFRHLEGELSAIRHEVEGDPFSDLRDRDAWVVGAAARARIPIGRHAALVAGVGLLGGEHGLRNGCRSRGFLDFCGARNDTLVYRHWRRAVWLRPELGGEVGAGAIAARVAVSPLFLLSSPDEEKGCLDCDDGSPGVLFTIGIHARLPL